MPSLTIIEPDKEPRTIALGSDPLIIGRSQSKCGLTFDFLGLSGRHCEIVQAGEVYKLLDLESANGTFVNNRAVVEHYLNHGDRIALGVIILTFNNELQRQPVRATPKSSAKTPAAAEPAAGPPPSNTYAEPTFIMDGQKLREKMERLRSGKVESVSDVSSSEKPAAPKHAAGGTAKDYARAATEAAKHDGENQSKKEGDFRWLFFGLGFVLALVSALALGMFFHVVKF